MKSRDGKREREEKRRTKIKKRKPEKKEDSGARKGIGVSPMICGSGGSKNRLAKAA